MLPRWFSKQAHGSSFWSGPSFSGQLIGVIMPCRNEEDTIETGLSKLLTQVPPERVVVVCDRCDREDRTWVIAARKRVRVIIKNWTNYSGSIYDRSRCIAESLNLGLRELPANVNYVMTFSPDGYLTPGYLEEVLEIFRQPTVMLVGYSAPGSSYMLGMGMVFRRDFLESRFGRFPEVQAQDSFIYLRYLELGAEIARVVRSAVVHQRGSWSAKSVLMRARHFAALGYLYPFIVVTTLRTRKLHWLPLFSLAFMVFQLVEPRLSVARTQRLLQKQKLRDWIRNILP